MKSDQLFQKMMQEFLSWMEAELKAERIKGGDFLLEYSKEFNVRVDFHDPDKAPEAKLEKNDDLPANPPPKSSMTRGYQDYMSANILGYYTAEFPSLKDVTVWAQSCPISYDGFALEVRQLHEGMKAISEATPEVKEWAGDNILFMRKQLIEQGKMKREEDGTLWAKVVEEDEIKEIVAEAEKREAQNEQV